MKTVIYYFSGTGNSLAAAKRLAQGLEGAVDLLPMVGWEKAQRVAFDGDLLGLVFPVYFLTVPDVVRSFLRKLVFQSDPYIFAVATCNAQPGHSLYSLKRLLGRKGQPLAAGFAIDMPGNAVIGKVDRTNPPEVQEARLANAVPKLAQIVRSVRERQDGVLEGCNAATMHIQSSLMNGFMKYLYRPSRRFRVLGYCSHCGVCARICPSRNIKIGVAEKTHKPL